MPMHDDFGVKVDLADRIHWPLANAKRSTPANATGDLRIPTVLHLIRMPY